MDEFSPGARRRHAPATLRNREAILQVLERVLPATGLILEIASGTGQHADFMAPALAPRCWQPTDVDPDALASIAGYRAESGCPEFLPPLALDVTADQWSIVAADAVVAINLIHIAPWSATEALMVGAARVLPDDGVLFLYGPFKRDGQHTASSNQEFDGMLRAQDRTWGVRDLSDVVAAAGRCGLALSEIVQMPANNLSVVLTKTG